MSIRLARGVLFDDLTARLGMPRPLGGYGEVIPHYNVGPGDALPTVCVQSRAPDDLLARRVRWGFIPSYATRPAENRPTMRLDQAGHRYWLQAVQGRRAVVCVNWAYVWRREGDRRQAYAICPANREDGFFIPAVWSYPRALAAVDERWQRRRTLAIITTEADASICAVTGRMPLGLTDAGAMDWIGAGDNLTDLVARLRAGMVDRWRYWAVSNAVDNPQNSERSVAAPVWDAELSVPGVTLGPALK